MKTQTMPQRALFPAAFALAALAGCNRATPTAPPAPPQVSFVTVQRTSVPVTTELPGRTTPYLVAQVRARVDGIVQKRSFQEGADVQSGQSMYQIDPAPYRAALNSAEAALQKAEANLATTTAQEERYKILASGNAVSKQAYDNALAAQRQAAADVAAAKAALATARINLGYTSVVAPIAGRSGISQVTQGAYVQGSAATLLTTIQQIDPIYVDLTQPSVAGLQLRRDAGNGQVRLNGADQARATLTLEDGTQYPLAGTLRFSGITVDPATGSVTLRAVFPNPKNVLLPGMFVRARIDQGVNDKAMLVPAAGLTHTPQGQASVMVVGADSKAAPRTVTTQDMAGGNWIVTGGLNEGERVIVAGIQKVQPGMLVHASEAGPAGSGIAKAPAPAVPGALASAAMTTHAK
jgi:membrane fusion protein (multidrug efflux system)